MTFLHDELNFAVADSLEKLVTGSQLVIETSINFLLYMSFRIWGKTFNRPAPAS